MGTGKREREEIRRPPSLSNLPTAPFAQSARRFQHLRGLHVTGGFRWLRSASLASYTWSEIAVLLLLHPLLPAYLSPGSRPDRKKIKLTVRVKYSLVCYWLALLIQLNTYHLCMFAARPVGRKAWSRRFLWRVKADQSRKAGLSLRKDSQVFPYGTRNPC